MNISVQTAARPEFATSSAGHVVRKKIALLLDRIIFFTLLALIILTAIPYGTVDPGWEALFECIVFALGLLWIVEGALSKSWHIRGFSLIAPILGCIVFALVQTLPLRDSVGAGVISKEISADPYATRLFILKLLALTTAGELLLLYTSSTRRLRALIYVVVGVGIASAMFGILRQATQVTTGFLLPALEPGGGYAQFINYDHFPFLMEMALGLVLGLVIGGGVPRNRILIYVAAAAPLFTALVLANSRGGIFSMFAQLIFIALLWNLLRSKQKSGSVSSRSWHRAMVLLSYAALITVLVLTVITSVFWIGGEAFVGRLKSVSSELTLSENGARNTINRAEMWRATWKLIKANPVAGVGFGGYPAAIAEYHDSSGVFVPQEAHNDYLELLASGGAIAMAIGVWFLVAFIRRARERLRSRDGFHRAAAFGASAGIFAVAVHSFVDFGLHITINALVFTALIVIANNEVTPKAHLSNLSR